MFGREREIERFEEEWRGRGVKTARLGQKVATLLAKNLAETRSRTPKACATQLCVSAATYTSPRRTRPHRRACLRVHTRCDARPPRDTLSEAQGFSGFLEQCSTQLTGRDNMKKVRIPKEPYPKPTLSRRPTPPSLPHPSQRSALR
jgi:hypothetical protein